MVFEFILIKEQIVHIRFVFWVMKNHQMAHRSPRLGMPLSFEAGWAHVPVIDDD
jgi:hypothetical protein